MAKTNANLIWKIADLLRGPYQPNQYGDVILPFTILRRLDCILEPTKEQVLAEYKKIQSTNVDPGDTAQVEVQAAVLQHLTVDIRLPDRRPGGRGRQPRRRFLQLMHSGHLIDLDPRGPQQRHIPVNGGLDSTLGAAKLPHRPRREPDQQRSQPPFHRESPNDDGLAQRFAPKHHRRLVSGPAAVRSSYDEFTAAQAAPHLAQSGGSAEPLSERDVIRRVGNVPSARAREQLPSVAALRSPHSGSALLRCRHEPIIARRRRPTGEYRRSDA